MFISKEKKTEMLDYLEAYCETSKVSKKTIGMMLRSYHISAPLVFLVVLFNGSQLASTIIVINLICVFICFFLFNGCLLTMLEHRLCGDEFTVADPFIEMLDLESTNRNRMFISYFIAIGYFLFFFIVYYFRFYSKTTLPAPNNI